jgi:Putative metallopeptidase
MASSPTRARCAGVGVALLGLAALVAGGCGGSGSSSTAAGSEGANSESGKARIVWQKPANEENAVGYELLRASETKEVAAALAKSFELPHPLLVRGVNGIGGGPFYNPEDNSITLPYGFTALVLELESKSNPELSPRELGEQAGAVDNFILAHEFAHALIANFELPVLGKEEDAADSISTALLLHVPGGAEYAADAAAFWADFSSRQEPPALVDYADAHSLDLQRAFDLLCWVAGSSKASFEAVAELEVLPESRLESCPSEYAQLVSSIKAELKPHLKHAFNLAPRGSDRSFHEGK